MDLVIKSLIAGVGGSSPILLLLWGYLRDLKAKTTEVNKTINEVQLKIAEANYDLKLKYLEQSFERQIKMLESKIVSLEKDCTLMQSQVDAAWKNIDKIKEKL